MSLEWIAEQPALWDRDKLRIIGEAPAGIFDARFATCRAGELLPGTWWRVQEGARAAGYGWLDVVWGDAEIVLAVDPATRNKGVGAFILERLGAEAKARGLTSMYNTVRPNHPEGRAVAAWLNKRGFVSRHDGSLAKNLGG